MYVYTPLDYPDRATIQLAEEPYAKVSLTSPRQEYVGNIMELCQNRRGEFKDMVYLDASRGAALRNAPERDHLRLL